MNYVILLANVVDGAAEGAGGFGGAVMDGDHRSLSVQGDEQVISANLIGIENCSADQCEWAQRLRRP
jgi:hypothetical protein